MYVVRNELILPPKLAPLIPNDKSWDMRGGVLNLFLLPEEAEDVLVDPQQRLSTDQQSLVRARAQWRAGENIDVGESGTLFRFLQFAAWSLGEDRTFIKRGTLIDRKITNDPSIVELPLKELGKLDGGTSQWMSAAVLLGNTETPPDPIPYKLQLTYDAIQHWIDVRNAGTPWQSRVDITIGRQALAWLNWKRTGVMNFEPRQSEDYCIARAFGLMTPEEGEARWPSLRQQESDRIIEMEEALEQDVVQSEDHRPVQAVGYLKGLTVEYAHPEAVEKSHPNFWATLDLAA